MRNFFGGLMLVVVTASSFSIRANEKSQPKTEDFKELAQGVMEMLQSGNAEVFAKAWSPAPEDWRAVRTRKTPAADEALAKMEKGAVHNHAQVLKSAQQVLAKAEELNVDFSKVKVTVQSCTPKGKGSTRYTEIQAEGDELQFARSVTVVLSAEPLPEAHDAERLRGEYRLTVHGLLKFSAGWRTYEGLGWSSFPSTVMDEKSQRELTILEKAASSKDISQDEDPALAELGEALVRFVRLRDIEQFKREAGLNFDAMWSLFQKSGRKAPSREEFEKEWPKQSEPRVVAPARAMIALMEKAGIDLSDATINVKQARFKRLSARGGPGTLDGLGGDDLQVILEVQSDHKSQTGASLSGEFTIGVEDAMRIGDRWYISAPIRWAAFPKGVVAQETMAALQLENYVAKHGALPPGTAAPDAEFIRVDNEKKGKLSDFRGKIVVLDFWATWCGPCQDPMAKMQKYHEENPHWKDRVELVSLSIDDTLPPLRAHINKRGWTNSINLWAGPGGWQAEAAKAYRVSGVPTCYILDAKGKIAYGGYPSGIKENVERLLK